MQQQQHVVTLRCSARKGQVGDLSAEWRLRLSMILLAIVIACPAGAHAYKACSERSFGDRANALRRCPVALLGERGVSDEVNDILSNDTTSHSTTTEVNLTPSGEPSRPDWNSWNGWQHVFKKIGRNNLFNFAGGPITLDDGAVLQPKKQPHAKTRFGRKSTANTRAEGIAFNPFENGCPNKAFLKQNGTLCPADDWKKDHRWYLPCVSETKACTKVCSAWCTGYMPWAVWEWDYEKMLSKCTQQCASTYCGKKGCAACGVQGQGFSDAGRMPCASLNPNYNKCPDTLGSGSEKDAWFNGQTLGPGCKSYFMGEYPSTLPDDMVPKGADGKEAVLYSKGYAAHPKMAPKNVLLIGIKRALCHADENNEQVCDVTKATQCLKCKTSMVSEQFHVQLHSMKYRNRAQECLKKGFDDTGTVKPDYECSAEDLEFAEKVTILL